MKREVQIVIEPNSEMILEKMLDDSNLLNSLRDSIKFAAKNADTHPWCVNRKCNYVIFCPGQSAEAGMLTHVLVVLRNNHVTGGELTAHNTDSSRCCSRRGRGYRP